MIFPLRFYSPQTAQMLMLYQQLQSFEKASSDQIRTVQYQQLFALFKHAAQFSPFWHERLQQAGFNTSKADIGHVAEVLQRLPALDRHTLQQQSANMRARWPALDEKRIITST